MWTIVSPRTLNLNNWIQFSARVPETDVSLVKNIALIGAPVLTYDLDRLMGQEAILQRCRSLEQIALTTSSEDMFKWAVQERKDFEDAAAVPHDARVVVASQQRLPLIRLQDYTVEFNRSSSGRQASDVLYAFGSTLRTINISFRTYWMPGYAPAGTDAQPSPDFKLGGFFDNYDNDDDDSCGSNSNSRRAITPSPRLHLPRLGSINIITRDTLLKLHPSLVARSPKLNDISLEDRRSWYSFSDVVYWEPGQCPDMVRILLMGTPAISFHPDTLKSTPRLGLLELMMPFRDSYSYIPDPEDFEHYEEEEDAPDDSNDNSSSLSFSHPPVPMLQRRQPIWTWDWDLPHLTNLSLTSEFAYRFEFRMLNGTPSLAILTIDFNSETGRHDRTIGMEDSIKPGFKHPLLRQFINRDRQLHRMREHLISYLPQHDERCFLQQQQEDADLSGDERLWREEFEFIHVPRLQNLSLNGLWKIDYRVLKALFSKVCPSLTDLNLPQAYGFTVPEWIKSTSEDLHNLRDAFVSIPFSAKQLETAGLVSADESKEAWDYGMRFKLAEVPVGRLLEWEPAVYSLRRPE